MNNEFVDKMKTYLDKGVEVSKDTLGKAGNAVQEFGNISVSKVEQMQAEQKLKQEYLEFGKSCYQLLRKNNSISSTDTKVKENLSTIENLILKTDKCKKNSDSGDAGDAEKK